MKKHHIITIPTKYIIKKSNIHKLIYQMNCRMKKKDYYHIHIHIIIQNKKNNKITKNIKILPHIIHR